MPETTDPNGGDTEGREDAKGRRKMSAEDFALFLKRLAPGGGDDEGARRYLRLHAQLVGFFNLRGIPDPADAADDTIDRAAAAIRDGKPVPDAEKYCRGIARNVAKERWRREQRESAGFADFVRHLAAHSDEQVEWIQQVLKPCFARLPPDDRRLLVAYCRIMRGRARAEHRRRLAEKLKTSVLGLRMRVTRLRGTLAACVKQQQAAGGPA